MSDENSLILLFMEFDEHLGLLVASWRKGAGLSQEGLAQAVGLQQAGVSRIESGKQSLYVEQLFTIMDACGVTVRSAADAFEHLSPKAPKPLWERIDE